MGSSHGVVKDYAMSILFQYRRDIYFLYYRCQGGRDLARKFFMVVVS
ncbi:hypothetical protein SRDD_28580 [Serratia sp. DD3]|nr:hypothetical protein SRDD_28580 [Serratia sp. DD3]